MPDPPTEWPFMCRADRRQRLRATCPICGADVLDELEYHADQSDLLSSTILVGCPSCEAKIEFSVEWNIELWKAEIATCYPLPAP